MALRAGWGPLITTEFLVDGTLRGLLISEERQGIVASCAGRLDNKPALDALTTESQTNIF
jgi:hypothetical protein